MLASNSFSSFAFPGAAPAAAACSAVLTTNCPHSSTSCSQWTDLVLQLQGQLLWAWVLQWQAQKQVQPWAAHSRCVSASWPRGSGPRGRQRDAWPAGRAQQRRCLVAPWERRASCRAGGRCLQGTWEVNNMSFSSSSSAESASSTASCCSTAETAEPATPGQLKRASAMH
jgi:hypothetical protein